MKIKFFKLSFFAVLFVLPILNFAQSISVGSDTAVVGENILIPLSTNALNNVGSMDIKITYDSTVLVYLKDTLQSADAAGTLLNVTSGNTVFKQINISWLAQGSSGVNIVSGNLLFFKFKYLGGSSQLAFNLSQCEISDWDGNPISVVFNSGQIIPVAGAINSIWNGNNNWIEAANWSNGIPGIATSAIVNSGNLEINSLAECNDLQIKSGSVVTILPNKSLTVYGNFENKGSIVVKSDSSGSGSFINYAAISGNGNITIEKFLKKTNAADYNLICSPVNNANISSPVFSNTSFQRFNEVTQSWQNIPANTSLQQGNAYLINCNADKKISFSDSIIVNGDVVFNQLTISNSASTEIPNGFNLVGNPYASAVNWNSPYWTKTNIDAAVYAFDGVNYVSWNGEIGSLTDGIIPSLQGFFVKVNANNPVLKMSDTVRLHNNQPFYKSKSVNNINELLLIKASGNNYQDVAYLNVKPNASMQFDTGFDAYKLFGINDAPQIYMVLPLANTKLSINVIDSIRSNTSVLIGFKVGASGVYSLNFENQSSFAPAVQMFLEDTKDNTVTNLRNTPVYSFTANPADNANRFKLDFYNPTSVEDYENKNVNIYAHNNILYIDSEKETNVSALGIYNMMGQRIKEIQLNQAKSYRISLPDLHGCFVIQYITDKTVISKKVNF